jgi:nucleoside-diphosphate-sugar epimerase
MRALVTGGASLVGSLLCERLLLEGHEVLAVDDLTSGSSSNLDRLKASRRFAFIEHDVSRGFDVEGLSAVYHLAVPSSRRRCARDPATAAVTSAVGTKRALELAARSDARAVVLMSSERFGGAAAVAEWIAETSTAVDVVVVRAAQAFGPRMDPDTTNPIARLVLDALATGEVARGWSCAPAIDLAWADDVAMHVERVMTSGEPGREREAASLAPAFRVAPAALAEIVAEACNASCVEHADLDRAALGDPASSEPPSALDVPPPPAIDLRDAVGETARWFAARMGRRLERSSGVYARPQPDHVANGPAVWPRRVTPMARRVAR